METISRSLLTFLLNSLWQIPLAATLAVLSCRLLRKSPANHCHLFWVAALGIAVLLPLASVRRAAPMDTPQCSAAWVLPNGGGTNAVRQQRGGMLNAVARAVSSPSLSLAETTADLVLGA